MSAVIRTVCSTPLPPAGLGLEPNSPPDEISDPLAGPGAGAPRTFCDEAGPVTGTAAPEAAVGMALNEATGLLPDEETEMPAPGEIWLEALSRLLPAPPPWPVSISLSSAVTSFEFP